METVPDFTIDGGGVKRALRAPVAKYRAVRRLRELKRARDRARADEAARARTAANGSLLYLHARPDVGGLREEVAQALRSQGCRIAEPASIDSAGTLQSWSEERAERILRAKSCDALGLIRPSDDRDFKAELVDIALDEREQIAAARGAPSGRAAPSP